MSMKVNIKIPDQLNKMFANMRNNVENNIKRGALNAAAKVMKQEVKRLVPVGETRELKRSVRHGRTRSKSGVDYGYVRAGGRIMKTTTVKSESGNKKGSRVRKHVGDAFYAHMVEYGTRPHFIGGGVNKLSKFGNITGLKSGSTRKKMRINGKVITGPVFTKGMSARPFMRPAFDRAHRQSMEAAAEYIRKRTKSMVSYTLIAEPVNFEEY